MTNPLITYNRNDAGFSVVSPNAQQLENDPTVKFQTSTGGITSQSSSSSRINTVQPVIKPLVFPASGPAPAPPDYTDLTSIEQGVKRKAAIAQAMKQYDDLSAATQASGFQSANNAGNVYANRLQQQGINPVASGVVAAQAKLPIYKQLADIGVQKETTQLDASNKADALAAQIASTIGQLKTSYANMLANFNTQQTGINLDYTRLQSGLGEQAYEYDNDYRLRAAQLASQYGTTTGSGSRSALGVRHPIPGIDGDPGYIPNAGPIRPGTGAFAGNGNSVALGW